MGNRHTHFPEFGFKSNLVAVLGVNVILLVNLSRSAVPYIRFLSGRDSFQGVQTVGDGVFFGLQPAGGDGHDLSCRRCSGTSDWVRWHLFSTATCADER
jgi:hypothetical protein